MTEESLAQLLATAAATFYRRQWYSAVPEALSQRCKDLAQSGVLSVNAIAAILGVSTYRVERILGAERPTVRGTLNPAHLSILAYMLSNGTVDVEIARKLVREGTSVGMISRLTLIPESTLYRRIK